MKIGEALANSRVEAAAKELGVEEEPQRALRTGRRSHRVSALRERHSTRAVRSSRLETASPGSDGGDCRRRRRARRALGVGTHERHRPGPPRCGLGGDRGGPRRGTWTSGRSRPKSAGRRERRTRQGWDQTGGRDAGAGGRRPPAGRDQGTARGNRPPTERVQLRTGACRQRRLPQPVRTDLRRAR